MLDTESMDATASGGVGTATYLRAVATLGAITFGALIFAAMSACNKSPAPTASAPVAAPSVAAPSVAAPTVTPKPIRDGVPRIVDSSDGVHIEYHVYGTGAPVLVLVHGWSCDSNYWNAQVQELKTRYTVVTVDLAGHGASGRNRTDWTMERFGDDVVAAVQALHDPKVILIGHSMGGPVVLQAARKLKEQTIAVIGIDTLKSLGLPKPSGTAQLAAMEKNFIGATRDMVDKMFTANADPVLKRRVMDDMSQGPPEVGLAAIGAMQAMDYTAAVKAVSVPIVLINADLGGATDAARLHKVASNIRVVTLKGLGHFLMMEDPKTFNAALEAELKRLTP